VTVRPITPLAEFYLLMDATSLAELADSIRRNGLRESIVLRPDESVRVAAIAPAPVH
jgi:ParB-like chromosome segregation protein Spo0J